MSRYMYYITSKLLNKNQSKWLYENNKKNSDFYILLLLFLKKIKINEKNI
jgi:hypothetical protein